MSDLIKLDKMSYTRRLFLISIITIMIYQLIDVTINYLQYPTIIKTDLTYFSSGDLPSLTFCPSDYDFEWKYADNYINTYILHYVFAYNIQQKSHTNISIKQNWIFHVSLEPKV